MAVQKITKILLKQGVKVSQKTVARIMKDGDIRSKTKKKYKVTTNSKHHLPVYPNLLNQQFEVNEPNQVRRYRGLTPSALNGCIPGP